MTTDTTDPFGAPTEDVPADESYAETFVKLAGLVDRLLLIKPVSLEHDVPSTFGGTQTRLTANVTVLDGKPLFQWADRETGKIQSMTVESIPHTFDGMFVSNGRLIDATYDARDERQPNIKFTLGRLRMVKKAYVLDGPSTSDMDAARKFLANAPKPEPARADASPFG